MRDCLAIYLFISTSKCQISDSIQTSNPDFITRLLIRIFMLRPLMIFLFLSHMLLTQCLVIIVLVIIIGF